MNLKNRLITCVLLLISFSCISLAQNPGDAQNAFEESPSLYKKYLIQVEVSDDSQKYFPKLYPIGYIVKETDEKTNQTTYLLAEFRDNQKATEALQKVKSLGYSEAFIVETK